MTKRKTISQRWYAWCDVDPFWCLTATAFFFLSVGFGLPLHLVGGWIVSHLGHPELVGLVRTIGLLILIGFDAGLLAITFFRRQLWWAWFFVYITVGVILFEIGSYFFGA